MLRPAAPIGLCLFVWIFPVQSDLALHTTLPNPEPTQLGDVEQRQRKIYVLRIAL